MTNINFDEPSIEEVNADNISALVVGNNGRDSVRIFAETTHEKGRGIITKTEDGKGLAGFFEGNVQVTVDISLLGGDYAEEFDVSCVDKVEPSTIMVLSSSKGELEPSSRAYDKRIAGVASGTGGFKPGIVLDKKQVQESNENKLRIPVALMAKVYCKVDANYFPIEVGDLLT